MTNQLRRAVFICAHVTVAVGLGFGQVALNQEQFRVFDGKGTPATLPDVIRAAGDNNAIFLGEQHDDAVAHAIQFEIFKRIVEAYSTRRRVGLSLEMFERDVQLVVDEYLNGLISEQHFLLSSRPWANYKTDYRSLVELAKEKRLPVIAANAPRRYVNMVSRGGRDSLKPLSKTARLWLAPLPYGQPSAAYSAKFKELMKGAPEAQTDINKVLASQSLWDATMANSVANFLKKHRNATTVHLNGGFHTEGRLGIVEHLLKYRPKAKVLVVTIKTETDFKTFVPAKHGGLGDFVILTQPARLRAILDRMETHRKALMTLRASFKLQKVNPQINVADTTSGSVTFLAPAGRRQFYLRTDRQKPHETFVMIGEGYELYRPALNMVYSGKVGTKNENGFSRAMSFMTMSRAQIKADHTVAFIGDEEISGSVKCWRIEITPRTRTSYRSATFWVDVDGMPRQVKVAEHNGDTNTVLLSEIVKNVVIRADVFKLTYPSSVKRIRI